MLGAGGGNGGVVYVKRLAALHLSLLLWWLLQVAAELTPLSVNKVGVQFKVFTIFGLISIKAPPSARGESVLGGVCIPEPVTQEDSGAECHNSDMPQPARLLMCAWGSDLEPLCVVCWPWPVCMCVCVQVS